MPGITRILPGSVLLSCLLFAVIPAAHCGGEEPIANAPEAPAHGPHLLSAATTEKLAADESPQPDMATEPLPSGTEGTPRHEENAAERPAQPTRSDQASSETTPPATPAQVEPPPKRVLTPAMAALRDRVRRTLAAYRNQALNARENTVTDLMHACLVFGCATEVYRDGTSGQKINGITCLCWNYPCAGYEPLLLSEGHIAARVGFGLQEHPAQFLAVLALSRVPPSYPVRVGQETRSVADLVEAEKLSCRSGSDLSLKLIGLAYYVEQPSWQDDLGNAWSLERIIAEELARPVVDTSDGGTARLLGLSYAVQRRLRRNEPLSGEFLRAQKLVEDFEDYALKLQNSDGSWGPRFLAARGSARDPATQLRATGHVLEWLAFSLPEERLQDPRVVRSIEYVNDLLSGQRASWNLRSLGSRDVGTVMHALHALWTYDERWFRPADADAGTSEPATAGRAPAPSQTSR